MIKAIHLRDTKPPKLPSKLLAMALNDLEWVEKHKKYDIYMDIWVDDCMVCFAGSVMVRRFYIDRRCRPLDFDWPWRHAFLALNYFREGRIMSALRYLDYHHHFKDVDIPHYQYDPTNFKQNIRELIKFLQEENL